MSKLEDAEKKKLLHQGFFYLVVGITSALIELVLFQVLYTLIGLDYAPSNIIALTTSTAYNFVLNGRVTFKGVQNKVRCLIKYLLLFAFNTTFTTCAIGFLLGFGWPSIIAKLCTMACVVLWNFVLYRKVIFV
jgi:putative flippase GtrA